MFKKILSSLIAITVVGSITLVENDGVLAATEGYYSYTITDGNAVINSYNGPSGDVVIPERLGGAPVVSFGHAFQSKSLTGIVIPDTVTHIVSAAFVFNRLTSVVIPENVTSIGNSAFADNRLTSVVLPNSLTEIGSSAFSGNKITSLDLPDNITSIENRAFSNNQLTSVSLPEGLRIIGDDAFANNQLTSLSIPNSVESIGSTAFANNQLTSLNLPDKLTSVGYNAFLGSPIKTVNIGPGWRGMEPDAFYGMSIESYSVSPENPMYKAVNGSLYTKDGTKLVNGTIGGIVEPGTSTIGEFAFGGMGLSSVTIPSGVEVIEGSAFTENNLGNLVIPEGVKSIGETAFANAGLTSVVIPKSVKTLSNGAFMENTLTEINLPEGLIEIGGGAFLLNQLTNVTVPASVLTMGDMAFYGNELSSLTILNKNLDSTAFEELLYTLPADTVIKGHSGSTAETFATENGFTFVAVSSEEENEEIGESNGSNASIPTMVRVIPGTLTFANELVSVYADQVSLNGQSQTLTASFNDTLDVIDARGVHTGYDIQVSLTDLISGDNVIAKDNITLKNLNTVSADGITGPVENISGASDFSLINLGAGQGIGQHTLDFSNAEMDVFVSDKTKAGIYDGTMTLSLVTTP